MLYTLERSRCIVVQKVAYDKLLGTVNAPLGTVLCASLCCTPPLHVSNSRTHLSRSRKEGGDTAGGGALGIARISSVYQALFPYTFSRAALPTQRADELAFCGVLVFLLTLRWCTQVVLFLCAFW